ncbi:MAG TPA: hypothetical protein VGG16_11085 [Streptosporangiaceae bacterium]
MFMSGVSAPGSNDVWAVGGTLTNSDQSFPVLEHWDGRAWKTVKMPASFKGFPFDPYQIAASSAADVWVFTPAGEPKTGPAAGRWAHWNGRSWTTGALPSVLVAGNNSPSVTITAAAAAGPGDVWVGVTVSDWNTKSGLPAATFLANDDRGTWRTYRLPASLVDVAGISALSRADVWAVATGDPGTSGVASGVSNDSVLMRFNGRSWQSIPEPKGAYADAVAGVSAHSAWVTGLVPGKGPDHVTYVAGAAYWNGARWTIVPDVAADEGFGQETDYVDALTSVTPDGRGGLWTVAEGYAPIVGSLPGPASLWHYANGRWTGVQLGSLGDLSLFQLARAPGSGSVWAVGTAVAAATPGYPEDGSILRYQN